MISDKALNGKRHEVMGNIGKSLSKQQMSSPGLLVNKDNSDPKSSLI